MPVPGEWDYDFHRLGGPTRPHAVPRRARDDCRVPRAHHVLGRVMPGGARITAKNPRRVEDVAERPSIRLARGRRPVCARRAWSCIVSG